jgi:PAS domain S-box-containing protein
MTAWAFLAASGVGLRSGDPWQAPLAHLSGSLPPALLVAGALAYRERRVPGWLLPGALAVGGLRAALVGLGRTELSWALGALAEPALDLYAAALLAPLLRRPGAAAAQRALAPSFVLLAGLEVAGGAAGLRGDPLPAGLLYAWVGVAPAVLALQVGALAQRLVERAREHRVELEARVAERTAQLAAANRSLEAEVAARRQVEESLRRSEERHRTVSELSSDLSFGLLLTPEGGLEIDWVTEAFSRLTGYPTDAFAQTPWERLLHPDDFESIREHQAAARRGERREFEARIVRHDGELRWLRVHLAGVRGGDARMRLVGAARDVTERHKAEEERRALEEHLRDLQRLDSLGVLAGGLAHDLNNLISVVLGNCALALGELPEDAPATRRLERIRAAARHAAALTDQMLTYSGRAAVSLKPLDLSRVVEGVRDLLEASLARGGRLEFALAGDLPPVQGDETQLRQVVVNLVSNAAEALEGRPGRVQLRTGALRADRAYLADAFGPADLPEGDYVFLEVRDRGRGIDASARARIFEPFYTTKATGRGLGLPAALGIVQGHRGAIKLESEPGWGTAFRVLLPSAAPPSRAAAAPRAARGARILVVEDDELVLELAEELLERAGFRVLGARAGGEALRQLGEGLEVAAVVLDLGLPDLGGAELCAGLRRLRPELPVVVVTGGSEPRCPAEQAGLRVVARLRKPYDAEALVESVRAALRGRA